MPHYNIKDGEISVWYDQSNSLHFSLILSNSDKRIQTVVLLTPKEVEHLLVAILNYKEA